MRIWWQQPFKCLADGSWQAIISIWLLVQMDLAIAVIKTAQQAEFAVQMSIKRLLQRLEMARSISDIRPGEQIPVERWQQVLQDMGV